MQALQLRCQLPASLFGGGALLRLPSGAPRLPLSPPCLPLGPFFGLSPLRALCLTESLQLLCVRDDGATGVDHSNEPLPLQPGEAESKLAAPETPLLVSVHPLIPAGDQ